MPASPGNFIWYELKSAEPKVAEAFYRTVVGWDAQAWSDPAVDYTVLSAGGRDVAGIAGPNTSGSGAPPGWVGYILVDNIEKATAAIKQAGGAVHHPPTVIPGVGRFAALADPQGARFRLLKPMGADGQPPAPPNTPGHIGWHELYAEDWAKAFDFYSAQFGWTKADAMDMGPMGTYQLFTTGGPPVGGMMNRPKDVPPGWTFYFNVDAIDAAAKRVTDGGGRICNGPMEVPGGSWIVQCSDPQGVMFALVAPHR